MSGSKNDSKPNVVDTTIFTTIFDLLLKLSETPKHENFNNIKVELVTQLRKLGITGKNFIDELISGAQYLSRGNIDLVGAIETFGKLIKYVQNNYEEKQVQEFSTAFLSFLNIVCNKEPGYKERFEINTIDYLITGVLCERAYDPKYSIIPNTQAVSMMNMRSASELLGFRRSQSFSTDNFKAYTLHPKQAVAVLIKDFDVALSQCNNQEQLEKLKNGYPKEESCKYLNNILVENNPNGLPPMLEDKIKVAQNGMKCVEEFKTALQKADTLEDVKKLHKALEGNKDYKSYTNINMKTDTLNLYKKRVGQIEEKLQEDRDSKQLTKNNLNKYNEPDGGNTTTGMMRRTLNKITGKNNPDNKDAEAGSLLNKSK